MVGPTSGIVAANHPHGAERMQRRAQVYVAELLRGMCVNLKEGERCTATMIAVLTALLDADEERWDAELQTAQGHDASQTDSKDVVGWIQRI